MPLNYNTSDFDLTYAQQNGPARQEFPFSNKYGDTAHILITMPMVQLSASYAPLAINTAATVNGASVFVVGDSPPAEIGADVIQFDRQFANIPSTHYDYETASITFPGYIFERNPNTQTATVQIERVYYKVGAGQTYANVGAVPLISETRVTDTNGLNVSMFSGGELFLNNGGGALFNTTPSLIDYKALVTANAYNIVIDSKPEWYIGGLWAVVTRRVKAK